MVIFQLLSDKQTPRYSLTTAKIIVKHQLNQQMFRVK